MPQTRRHIGSTLHFAVAASFNKHIAHESLHRTCTACATHHRVQTRVQTPKKHCLQDRMAATIRSRITHDADSGSVPFYILDIWWAGCPSTSARAGIAINAMHGRVSSYAGCFSPSGGIVYTGRNQQGHTTHKYWVAYLLNSAGG
jgi:hypothetical protein